jgi:hypothetical protein
MYVCACQTDGTKRVVGSSATTAFFGFCVGCGYVYRRVRVCKGVSMVLRTADGVSLFAVVVKRKKVGRQAGLFHYRY